MTQALLPRRIRKRDENLLFIKQLIKNPKSVGAIVPSSTALANLVSQYVTVNDDEYVVELGAGTGRLTQALLRSGIPTRQIMLIEVDRIMCDFLRHNLPGIAVIEGDAACFSQLIPEHLIGKIKTVVSGIPMINLPLHQQKNIVDSVFSVLSPGGYLLQFTYGPVSPLPVKKLGLCKKRLGHVFFNFPPATIWCYYRQNENVKVKKYSPFLKLRRRIRMLKS